MRSLLIAVVVLAGIASAGLFSPPKKPEVTMYDFLKGEWDMVVYRSPLSDGEIPEETQNLHFTMTPLNGTTDVLNGVYITDDGSKYFQIRMLDRFSGEFNIPSDKVLASIPAKPAKTVEKVVDENNEVEEGEEQKEEEAEEEEIAAFEGPYDITKFKFNFQNLTALHFITQGKYGNDATYQATISSAQKPSFVFTIRTDKEMVTLLAVKYLPAPQPSFFQKYGMLIMMSLMMFMQMRAKPQIAGQQNGEGGDAAAAPAPEPAAAQ